MAAKSSFEELKREANRKSSGKSTFQELKEKATQKRYSEDIKNVDESYIKSFFDDASSYMSDSQKELEGMDWKSYNSYYSRDKRYGKTQDLGYRAGLINYYLENSKDRLDTDTYSTLSKALSDYQGGFSQLDDAYDQYGKYFSQWGSDDEYQTAVRYDGYNKKYTGKSYQDLKKAFDTLEDGEEKDWLQAYKSGVYKDEMLKFDHEKAAKNVESLESILNTYGTAARYYDMYQANPEAYAGSEYDFIRQWVSVYEDYQKNFGSQKDLENHIHDIKLDINNAKRIQKGAELASVADPASASYDKEFNQYAAYDDSVKIPTIPDYEDIVYGLINGDQAAQKGITMATAWSKLSDPEKERLDAVQYMTPEEVALYNYYYNKHGYDAAEEYLESIVENLNYLHSKEIFSSMEGNTVAEMFYGIGAGFDQANSGLTSLFSDKDYIPTTATQYASGMVREDLAETGPKLPDWMGGASLGQGAYDAITTTANMAPSILTSVAVGAINPALGTAAGNLMMGASATGNAYQEALNLGYDKGQARTYSTLVGASEVGLQYLMGGIGKLGGKISGKAVASLASKFDNAYIRLAVKYGANMISEGSEEYLQEILTPLFKNLALKTDEEIELITEDAIYSFLLGALTSGVMEVSGISSDNGKGLVGNLIDMSSKNKANINAVEMYGGSTSELIKEGLASDPNSESHQFAEIMQRKTDKGKTMTGYEIRQQVEANEAQFAVEAFDTAKTTAKERLVELGETKNIDKIAKLVAKRATGQELTRAEISTLAHSQFGAQVAKEMTTTEETKSGAKAFNTNYKDNRTYKPLEERVGTEARFNVAESGEATVRATGEKVDLENFEVTKLEDGEMTIKAEGGEEVYAGDIDFANEDQAYAFSAVADIENITPAAATAMVKSVDYSKPVGAQLNGLDEAYTYGYYGYSEADLKAGDFTGNLTSEQMMSAYKLGQSARKIGIQAQGDQMVKMRTAKEAAISKKEKVQQQKARFESDDAEVYFMDGGTVTKFDEAGHQYDETRMAGVNTAKFLSKLGIGKKYYFYESYVNAEGKRVYKDANGNEVAAPNGMYKAADGSIYIDLNAGNEGQGVTLFTLGHELGHFIKQWSPQKFQVLADFLVEEYGKTDMTMRERVLEKQSQLEQIRGEKVSYDEAYEEVVADAMSTMFADGKLHEKLAKLRAKDKSLFNKIKQFIDNLVAKFRDLYASLTPDQKDAQDVREMKDAFDRIQTAFAEALVEASENFQASESALAQAGISVDANTDAGSIYSVRDVLSEADRKKVTKALVDRFGVTQEEAKAWLTAETSLASLILNPKYSAYLDYEGDPNEVAIKQNSDYPQGTVDFSNICKKRREFTQVMNSILRNFPNHVFAATDLAKIRTIMGEEGMTLPCGICYVEDRRQLDTIVAQDFINSLKLYREGSKTRPDGKPFNANQIKGLQLTDGDTYVPTIYELVSLEGRNSLKAKNPNMEAAWVRFNNARGMQAVRLLTNEAEYKRQILKYSKSTVKSKNDRGGLRIYSFSDAEMFHLIDIIQVITDSAAVGLSLQGYTKVNEYAKAVKDTGEKLNRSLIPKGDLGYHIENGKVVLDYDTVEGIDIYHKDFFDNKGNPNVGNITIGINDVQIRASMVSDFVDQIIPFHTGQSEEVLGEKGIAAWDNYKDSQTEKDLATGKTSSHQINIYTEVFQAAEDEGKPIQNKRQFVEKFLQVCKENGLQPRFAQFLNTDANGDYTYTEGYHKFLVDFKTFAQTEVGEYLPQMPVKPIFDDAYITGLLKDYVEEQQAKDAEVAKQMPKVIKRITNEIVKADGYMHSDRIQEGYDTRNLAWAIENGIIDESDQARFWEAIAEIQKLNYNSFARTKNGGYIIETSDKMMFTDGDYKAPTLSKVIVFPYGEFVDTSNERTMIRNEARNTGRTNQSTAIIENLYGPGFVTEYYTPRYRADGRSIGQGERTNRSGSDSESGSRGVRYAETDGLQPGQKVSRDFLADDQLKGNYKVSEISEMFDAWNSDTELTELSKKVFAKLQEIMDGQEAAYWATPYPIRFKSESYLQKEYYNAPHGVFEPSRTDGNYGITYNLDYFRKASDQDKARILLHEAIHACTVAAIKSTERRIPKNTDPMEFTPDDSWSDAQKASLELIQTFSQVRVANERNEYGQKNVYEMVAEMSNPEFRAMLKRERLWGRIVDAIKRIFGIENRTAYDSVSDALERILELDMPKADETIRRSDRDSTGKQLGEDQLEYFEDSMARDRNGNLQVVYHGGTVEYEFDTTRGGNGATQYGPGSYFTDSEYYAKQYTWARGGDVKAYYLNINKMFDDTDMGATSQMPQWSKLEEILRKNGIEEKFIKRFADDGFAYMSRYLAIKAGAKTSGSWEGSEKLNAMLREAGFDGIKGYLNDVSQYVIFTPNQAKLTSNEVPSAFYDTRYSERTDDSVSNRSLLANAFEWVVQNSEEYKLIQEYKGQVKMLNKLEEQLSDTNAEIRKLTFGTEGARDMNKLQELREKADRLAHDINRHDKRLLSLEASEPLRRVIEQERKKAAKKTKDHVAEIQQNKKLRAEQTELRHKIRKTIRDLDKILNRGNKKLNVKEDVQNVVTKALQAADILFTDNYGNYDMLRNGITADLSDAEEALVNACTRMLKDLDKMPTDGYDNFQARQEAENRLRTKMSGLKEVFARERKRLNNTTVSSILNDLAEAYASLEKSDQSYVQGAYSEAVHNYLKSLQSEVGGTIVRDMTKNQLESLYAAYKMVLTTVRKANQMFNEELKQSREQLGNAVIQEVMSAGGVHGLWTKGELKMSDAMWNNMKPVWLANRIGSDTFGKLMKGLFQGQYNFAVDIDEAKQFKLAMDKKYHPRNWDTEKQYKFTSSTGKEFSMDLQQIMSLYAYSKRAQSYSHLLNGGFVFEGNSSVIVDKKGIKRTYIHNGATAYKLNEATLNGIINTLSAEQKAYVDEMQKYLSDVMGAKGNEVSMKLYGIKMFNEQFYFPLRSSGAYLERAKEAELKKQQGQINLVNSGFTHSIKPEAKNPVILSEFLDVWAEHCNEMSMYHSMVLPMEDFRKVYNYSTVHDDKFDSASVFQTIQDAYGKAATSYIDQLYRELNTGATIDPRETPFKSQISKFKKAAVMLSASVVVQQFSAIGRAYAIIDPKYFIGTKVNSTQLSSVDEMKKYAPVAIIKEMGGFDTGTKGSAKSYIMAEEYGKGERIKGIINDEQYRNDLMGYLPAKADEKTWCAIWEAAKRETKAKNPRVNVRSEEFLKLAGELFSETIEKTQVYDSVLARSANMRSKGAFMSMATAFMAEPTTTVNLMEDAIRSRNAKQIARAFGAVAVSIVLNNALASIVYAMRDDDEDETFIEKYFQSFASSMVDDINPMSYYPFLKDVYSLFQGYDVERADMSVIADVRDALKKSMSIIGKDTSNMDENELAEHRAKVASVLLSLLDAGCSMFGVPLKNVRRDANGIINAYKTISTDITEQDGSWGSFWDKVGAAVKDTIPIYAWTKDRTNADKLYDAIINGDQKYLAKIKSGYKTEESYHTAVRKALRENDPRIKEAAQAQINGNPSERVRIAKQIIADGFALDDVITAINSEINAMTPSTDSGTTKVKGLYKVEDFVREAANGDMASLSSIRDDILKTAQANGKSKEEAEEDFASSIKSETKELYLAGSLRDSTAKALLMQYVGMDEAEVAETISYLGFCKAHPGVDLSQSQVGKYQEFAEPANIPLDVFEQYVNGTAGLKTIRDEWGDEVKSKREQVLEVIHSLPLTRMQKDALYLAAGYAESKIWDVPW